MCEEEIVEEVVIESSDMQTTTIAKNNHETTVPMTLSPNEEQLILHEQPKIIDDQSICGSSVTNSPSLSIENSPKFESKADPRKSNKVKIDRQSFDIYTDSTLKKQNEDDELGPVVQSSQKFESKKNYTFGDKNAPFYYSLGFGDPIEVKYKVDMEFYPAYALYYLASDDRTHWNLVIGYDNCQGSYNEVLDLWDPKDLKRTISRPLPPIPGVPSADTTSVYGWRKMGICQSNS